MDIENRETFLQVLRADLNVFLGAGFSTLAADTATRPLPAGEQLAADLRCEFNREDLTGLDLPKLYTVLCSTQKEEVDNYLRTRFTVGEYDPRYAVLDRLRIRTIFTTNIDNLIHKIFEKSRRWYINDLDFAGPVQGDRKAVDLVMLHGSVLRRDRPLRFGVIDVASSFGVDPDRWRYLQMRLRKFPTVFWGYSVQDAATLEALAPISSGGGQRSNIWILVRQSTAPADVHFWKALGLQTIMGDTSELLDFLLENVSEYQPEQQAQIGTDTRSRFPDYCLPSISEIVSRPISDFFRGAPPSWSDVFSGQLYHSSHYRTVRDSMHSPRHTLVTGVPASGKTTLLMQLASEFEYRGHKLFLDALTPEKAYFLIRCLETEHALVFIDNCTDDVEALAVLTAHQNIKIVGADRDYNLTTVIHRIPREKFNILDVTELTEKDLQGFRNSIPPAIRTDSFARPEVTQGLRPALFEFIQVNVVGPDLRDRVVNALRRLARDSPPLAEMVLFVAYVHFCRTPVSMDMAIAYWGGSDLHYTEIYDLFNKAGAIITEYEGHLADEPQDYFAARSQLAAEYVVRAATDLALRGMLRRFHSNISPMRVSHYNVFKRHAYDTYLTGQAFPDLEDGKQFYDLAYARDPSPYILQQRALYLSQRKRYIEAFQAIDRAIAQAGPNNWTIRNTHAQILFRANIEFAEKPTARETLDHSMSILAKCYGSDRRKAFHAMVFADHALRYWKAYRDDQAKDYLRRAATWLAEAIENEPWLDHVPRLQKLVNRELGTF